MQPDVPAWAWEPERLSRLFRALLVIGIGVFVWSYVTAMRRWAGSLHGRLRGSLGPPWRRVLAVVGATVYYVGGVAVGVVVFFLVTAIGSVHEDAILAGSLVVIVASVVVVIFPKPGAAVFAVAVAVGPTVTVAWRTADVTNIIRILFLFVLPWLNGLLDWISLSVSRWFGRAIVAERDSPRSLLWTLGLAIADLCAAVAFAFGMAWLLAFGIEASAFWFDLSLELESYVIAAAESPWTTGFWATFMVLSTLFPTAVHFVLAVGAITMAWSGNPLRAWAARKLASGNEAEWLGPQLYLTFGWLVPTLLVPAALIWLIGQAVGVIEPLPDALRDTALDGIATAQAWLR